MVIFSTFAKRVLVLTSIFNNKMCGYQTHLAQPILFLSIIVHSPSTSTSKITLYITWPLCFLFFRYSHISSYRSGSRNFLGWTIVISFNILYKKVSALQNHTLVKMSYSLNLKWCMKSFLKKNKTHLYTLHPVWNHVVLSWLIVGCQIRY